MILLMIALFLFIIGLAVGSFISASAWRLYNLEFNQKKNKFSSEKLSITKGRSMCEHCGHTLAAKDLIPLFSWLSLKGKCRYCGVKLSWEYPLVEILTGILFVLSYASWQFVGSFDIFSFIVWLIILSGLILLALFDIKWFLLPNKIIYPLIALAIIYTAISGIFFSGGTELIRDSVLGLIFAGGSFYLIFLASKGRWIGGGDVKLAIFIGIYLGLSRSMLTFILAFNTAAIVVLPLLATKVVNRKTKIPFGPFLIGAIIISALFGNEIIEWYKDNFLQGLV